MNIRDEALNRLEDFSNNNLGKYAADRNFDPGPENRNNTSLLSQYISHRIIDEQETIRAAYQKFPFKKIEKFVQEVFWRTYWKGWLEMRPQVWDDYNQDLNNLQNELNSSNYKEAIEGNTKIPCFNDWVLELKEFGYLHNHARMWFASIWIFTLGLPWQLGADFFLKHLLDGDAASNTLGWRWVAGLHTKGKHYLASEWNINKFSAKKYEHLNLNEQAQAKHEDRSYDIQPILFDEINSEHSLFVFHNLDCSLHLVEKEMNYNHYALIDFTSLLKKENYSPKVLDFKIKSNQYLTTTLKEQFNSQTIIQNKDDLQTIIKEKNIKNIIFPYLAVGYENDFIKEIKKECNIYYLARDYDKYCWQFSTKGFFKFKEQIPKIMSKFL
ncbi:FAD-binding domain-containing protein [Pelagibacteraceae bacterium]|nr:FAD-binding domain-containing protein [Pelagibacteraceae bacterium]